MEGFFMEKTEELRQWFMLADADLTNAEFTITQTYPANEGIVCFHCQQCVEKYLKGFLRLHDVVIEKTHDLTKLLPQCGNINAEFYSIETQCVALNRYSVIPRYPVEWEITKSDVQNALQYAKEVKAFVGARVKEYREKTMSEMQGDIA
jgi:HEPN domain-containing protein